MSRQSTLTEECVSTRRSGSYARFYNFSLRDETRVKIGRISSNDFDTYMHLLEGESSVGEVLAENDDRVENDRRDSQLFITLPPGDYTVEATTKDSNQ